MHQLPTSIDPSVCVVIAAYNASGTIARAIRSALVQPEVAEVLVVDDASSDATAKATRASDDGTGRLTVIELARNVGPSAARNIAIAQSRAPFVAILDSDDVFLSGRFAALLEERDWDMVADNIVFVDEAALAQLDEATIAAHRIAPRDLTATDFVEGSISRADRYKGELGFLKPVLSREFLDRHALRYAEEMRLSEDYDLYVRALIAGARFRIVAGCHYVAVERAGSLSVNHGVVELAAVDAAMRRLRAAAPTKDVGLRDALKRHHAQIGRKWRHRAVLARKHEIGTIRALRNSVQTPAHLIILLADVLADKLRAIRPGGIARRHKIVKQNDGLRFLL